MYRQLTSCLNLTQLEFKLSYAIHTDPVRQANLVFESIDLNSLLLCITCIGIGKIRRKVKSVSGFMNHHYEVLTGFPSSVRSTH